MLGAAKTGLFNPLVPTAHIYSERQHLLFPLQIKPAKVSESYI